MGAPSVNSRYRFSLQATDAEGRSYLTEAERLGYVELDDNRIHVVRDGDDVFGLAGEYFANLPNGDDLWWVICHFQPEPIHDPTIALEAGATLVIPSERTVREQILSSRRVVGLT